MVSNLGAGGDQGHGGTQTGSCFKINFPSLEFDCKSQVALIYLTMGPKLFFFLTSHQGGALCYITKKKKILFMYKCT